MENSPPPSSVILIFNFLSFRRKTQRDVPSWDSSPSSEEEHPYVVPEPDHTSISAHSYVDMDEVRQYSNLIVATTSLSTQNEIWSQLFFLFLQDSPPKPKIKKLAKAPTTPLESRPESPTLTYTTAPADTTAHRRGITCWEMVPQAAPRHTRARTESFLEWRSVESVSVVTLPSQSLWRQCHAMASFSICHAIFIGFIIVSALFRMYCISVY